MGLCPFGKSQLLPTFTSIDQYVVNMHSLVLSDTLDAISTFAGRVIPSIEQAPSAVMWPISGPLLITRERWLRFCRGVLALLRLLAHMNMDPSTPRSWPDADRLIRAAARARAACGPFVAPRWRHAAASQRLPDVGRVMAAAAAAALSATASAADATAHSG